MAQNGFDAIRPPFADFQPSKEDDSEPSTPSKPEDISMEEDDPLGLPVVPQPPLLPRRRPLVRTETVSAATAAPRSLAPGPKPSHHQSSSSLPSSPLASRKRPPVGGERHYKKDSRFVMDLYTLTFDEGETVDDVAAAAPVAAEYMSLANPMPSLSFSAADSSGPMSLQSNFSGVASDEVILALLSFLKPLHFYNFNLRSLSF